MDAAIGFCLYSVARLCIDQRLSDNPRDDLVEEGVFEADPPNLAALLARHSAIRDRARQLLEVSAGPQLLLDGPCELGGLDDNVADADSVDGG